MGGQEKKKRKKKLVIDGEDRLSVKKDIDQLYFLIF